MLAAPKLGNVVAPKAAGGEYEPATATAPAALDATPAAEASPAPPLTVDPRVAPWALISATRTSVPAALTTGPATTTPSRSAATPTLPAVELELTPRSLAKMRLPA